MSCTNQLLINLKNVKHINLLEMTIWGADLADMQLISKCNKGIRFSLCVIDIYSEYAWVVLLKDKVITITNAFQKVLHKSMSKGQKPNKKQVNKGSEFYEKSMKSWLQDNNLQMYSTDKKESLLLLKDLSEPSRIKFLNI